MKQNKYFSLKRFARLLRNDWLIHQKTYYFSVAGLSLAIYALAYFSMYFGQNFHDDNYSALFATYLLGVGVLVGTAFPALNDQIKRSSYLLMPGSTLEKFLVQFLIRFIILIPLALLIFWVSVHLAKASLIANPYIEFDVQSHISDFHFNKLFEAEVKKNNILYLSIFSFGTALFAGATFFNRFALVKTLIVFVTLIVAVLLSLVIFSHLFYPAQTNGFEIAIRDYNIRNVNILILYFFTVCCLSWLFLMPLAYFKLKEKEV